MFQMAKQRTFNENEVHTINIGLEVTYFYILQAQKLLHHDKNNFVTLIGNKLQLNISASAYLAIHHIPLPNSCILGFNIIPIPRCYYLSKKETTKEKIYSTTHAFAVKPINSWVFNGLV